MTNRIPLGEKENLHQEFKRSDALKRPETIGREVVALLNAEGGAVWVGLRDEGDQAVAVEPVADAERERHRLREYLVDTIEPSPANGEVGVEVVPLESGGEILRVDVHPLERRVPYAHLKEGGRFFLIRIDDRARPMAREEIFAGEPVEADDRARRRAAERLREERTVLEKSGGHVFWLGIEPVPEIEIDLDDSKLADYLTSPIETGNRRMGWNFRFTYPPSREPDALVTNPAESRFTEIRRDGGMRFRLPLKSFHWKGEPAELGPHALAEFPVSAFRITRKIYQGKLLPGDQVLADMAFIGLQGWKLRPGSPALWGLREPKEFTDSKDLVWESPRVFSFAELESDPDRCGYRFVQRVYEAFGFGRDAIPEEFDRKTGRLFLPE
ncbi:MAG TPA: ATP-binding protein [Thermoanaerobaculia bacterium]|nr:ATP-binding protein [Thermoanaerobaculia bacterium]